MSERIHLADEEDDLYTGYNEFNPALDTEGLEEDEGFQQAVRTSYGRRPPVTGRLPTMGAGRAQIGTAAGQRLKTGMVSSMGRPTTGMQDGQARPMTAVRAAGYTSSTGRGGFDPLNQGASRGPAPSLESRSEDSPEEKVKLLERKVNELVEESCMANSRVEMQLALEKAKEAGRKERVLVRQKEQMSVNDQINLDLTYSVLFNLGNQYEGNEMFTEAFNTYMVIVKNKMFNNAGRLKVNMGNIYYIQRDYQKAIKYYRMALDQVPNTHKEMSKISSRIKIMQNIGIMFVKLGQYTDAVTSFETIMSEKPDIKTGFNLVLCYYALGDREKMKKSFQKLLHVNLNIDDEEKYISHNDDDKHTHMLLDAIRNDSLREYDRKKKHLAETLIMSVAKLIAPVIDSTFAAGFDWCVECVKLSPYVELANDLEINKAISYLKQKEFGLAVETLKNFEKKDAKMASPAATNLSAIYFLEKDFKQAVVYADVAMASDRYNPGAIVNKGNIHYQYREYEKAKDYYTEALRTESSCVEALYNLGLANKKLGDLGVALENFMKLHSIIRNSAEVLYQISHIYDMLEETTQATEWFLQCIGTVPTDPVILSKLGEIYDEEGDKSQAFQYHFESYRHFPSNIRILEWLGAYYIESQFYEKAIHYFEKACLIQPNNVQWPLMVASCYRRSGNYPQALETYKSIHRRFPDNLECLRFIVRICTDLGLKEAQDYSQMLKKAEKQKEAKSSRQPTSATRRGNNHRVNSGARLGSAGSDTRAGSSESGGSRGGGPPSGKTTKSHQLVEDPGEQFDVPPANKHIDASYMDPLGPSTERPKTAARVRPQEDGFADEELGDDLLPE